jgi:hypothetical protein
MIDALPHFYLLPFTFSLFPFPFSLVGDIKADIDKTHWNSIKQEGREIGEKVFIRFPGAKIYSKNENWSDYAI